MSRYIVLRNWSGDDSEDISVRLAKVFRMTSVRAAMIVQDVSSGRPWRFEHTVSDSQSEPTKIYLQTLGFEVDLKTREEVLAEEAAFAHRRERLRMDTAPVDTSSVDEPGLIAWFNRLKQVLTPRTPVEKTSILDMVSFLRGGKQPAPSAEPIPEKAAPQPQPKPGFLDQLSFLKRKKATSPAEAPAKEKSRRQSMALFGLLIWLALPAAFSHWIGMQVETRFSLLPELVSRTGSAMLINKRFEGGWFRSSGENVVRFPSLPFYLTLDHEVIHGPIDFKEVLNGNYDKALINFRVDSRISLTYAGANLENIPPMKMQTIFYLNGEAESRFEVPPHHNAAPVQIDWQGLRGELSLNSGVSGLQGSMEVLPFKLNLGGNSVDAQPIKGGVAVRANPAEPTTMSLDVSRIELKDDKKATALQGYKVYFMVKEAAGAREYVLNQSFDELSAGEDKYGSGTLNLRAHNLDMAAFGRLREEFARRRNNPDQTPETINAREQKIGNLIRSLLEKKPALEIAKLHFKTSEGEVDGRVKLRFEGPGDARNISLESAFQNADAEAMISIPAAFLKKPHPLPANDPSVHIDIQLPAEDWEKDGYLIRKDQNYEAVLSVKQGKFILNGKPFDPFPKIPNHGVATIAPATLAPVPNTAPATPQP